MSPESVDYLAIARKDLNEAKAILAIGLAMNAARCSYFAAFHAAEAAIFEITGKIAKTHSGVHSEYARLNRDRPAFRAASPAFLATAYRYKQGGDYGIGGAEHISQDLAQAAIDEAALFVDTIEAALGRQQPTKE